MRLLRWLALWFRRRSIARTRLDAEHVLRSARATMRRKRYCVLATSGADGVDARVLQPFAPDDDLGVWLGTHRGSRKARQIEETGRATLVYEDDAKSACVTLVGRARLVDDPALREAHFGGLWYAFFPRGPIEDDYVLVRFEPERVEVVDFTRHVTPAPFGLRAAVLTRRAGTWALAA